MSSNQAMMASPSQIESFSFSFSFLRSLCHAMLCVSLAIEEVAVGSHNLSFGVGASGFSCVTWWCYNTVYSDSIHPA